MFDNFLSNGQMKKELELAAANDKPMHAYMFCGAKGTGKLTIAKMFAKEIIGKNANKVDRDSHPDIIIIEPEKDKKTIPVDAVREMRSDAFINPSEAKRKIYIINGAHLLNDAGQNALLTILEQPPSFAVFILLTESRDKMLPTVISRCIVYDMQYVEADEGAAFLKSRHKNIDLNKLTTALKAAGGNIGLAERFATSSKLNEHEKLSARVLVAAALKDRYTVLNVITTLKKDALLEFLPILAMYIRDVLVFKTVKNPNSLIFTDSVLQNIADFDKIDDSILYDSICEIERGIELINSNISATLTASSIAIQLCGGKQIG